mgnify:CR=1 FL=1
MEPIYEPFPKPIYCRVRLKQIESFEPIYMHYKNNTGLNSIDEKSKPAIIWIYKNNELN